MAGVVLAFLCNCTCIRGLLAGINRPVSALRTSRVWTAAALRAPCVQTRDEHLQHPASLEERVTPPGHIITRHGTPIGVSETRLLELEQIQEMAGEGVEFGSHGMGYRSLPGLDDSALMRELSLSREVIEAVTGKPVRAFSYPYSHVDARAKKAVRATGYECAFAVNGGHLLATRDL